MKLEDLSVCRGKVKVFHPGFGHQLLGDVKLNIIWLVMFFTHILLFATPFGISLKGH